MLEKNSKPKQTNYWVEERVLNIWVGLKGAVRSSLEILYAFILK